MMKHLILLLLFVVPCQAQLPDAPKPKAETRKFILAQVAMAGSSAMVASSARYGARRCIAEGDRRFIPHGPLTPSQQFRSSLRTALIADAAVFGVSYLLHRMHHHQLALLLPIASAASQVSIGATEYSAGCF